MICKGCNKKVDKIHNVLIDSQAVWCDVDCHGENIKFVMTHYDYAFIDDLKVDFNTNIECKLL